MASELKILFILFIMMINMKAAIITPQYPGES